MIMQIHPKAQAAAAMLPSLLQQLVGAFSELALLKGEGKQSRQLCSRLSDTRLIADSLINSGRQTRQRPEATNTAKCQPYRVQNQGFLCCNSPLCIERLVSVLANLSVH